MVLTPARLVRLCSCSVLALLSVPAGAQELDRATPLLEAPKEYQARPIQIGPVSAFVGGDVRLEYDSNIYALPSDKIDDMRATLAPRVNLALESDRFELAAEGSAVIRRYFDNKTENSEAGKAELAGVYRFSETDSINAAIEWQRLVEQRGEPESQTDPATSPRRYDRLRGELAYNHIGSRITIGLKGTALRNNALARIDEERDFDQYSGQARIGYRVSGIMSAFGEGFIVVRDFDLPFDTSGIDRDSRTYGARVGLAFEPGGLLSGEAAVGVFRFKPDDPAQDSRTGLSVSAALVYAPTPRLAITLDGFRGDVATVRTGARSRTDTRLRLGVQSEVRHNLRLQGSLLYRRSNFVGTGQHERTLAGIVELEYLLSRHIALALMARIADRSSTRPADEFDRAIFGAEIRFQF
ncbi:outer membrane beta-barrel protein [Sphingobium cloacae]|uniref:Uncharacterized protein n=1 Tax=Sphingobium cloacae TaxID=120107 RepID=A0A1E1F556_9SPHN|nr:outer membrane beta-barrel protein [Sphingobium cloacae]BAV65638.1 hypothetical protein SCLO_1025980 [Sphingobium cloacae]